MDLMWIVYLLNVLSNLSSLFIISSILLVAVVVFTAIFYLIENGPPSKDDDNRDLIGLWKKLAVVSIFVSIFAIFTPDQKTIYLMAGAYGTQKVIESPQGQQMADKIMSIVNAKIDQYVEEAKGGKKSKK